MKSERENAGSVDEGKDEQGIAHLVEHVTFLGSAKREGLLGTGARSNAYTDFHHTVFHVHAPLVNTSFGEPSLMLPQVCNRPAHSCLWSASPMQYSCAKIKLAIVRLSLEHRGFSRPIMPNMRGPKCGVTIRGQQV